jgi:hypothetical protein
MDSTEPYHTMSIYIDINNCNDPNYLVIRIDNYTIFCNSSLLLLLYYMTILSVITPFRL